jgi:hypothetical protein
MTYDGYLEVLRSLHFLSKTDFDSEQGYLALDIWDMCVVEGT